MLEIGASEIDSVAISGMVTGNVSGIEAAGSGIEAAGSGIEASGAS